MLDIFVDFTHVARRSSGIERIAKRLFSPAALAPLVLNPVHASSGTRAKIVLAQWLKLPMLAWTHPGNIFIFPGYPPSLPFPIWRVQTIMYVHDTFLLTRQSDLNRAAKYYMVPQFRRAIKQVRLFFCNSQDTERKLRPLIDACATTMLFRPAVDNVFELTAVTRAKRNPHPSCLKVVSVGTVEPRKNFRSGVKICAALASRLGRTVEYHIIGRNGWGPEWGMLSADCKTVLHGYLEENEARVVIESADVGMCTSHEEGLGLPLLELQYSGIPVIAPDGAVFREVLGTSGVFIDTDNAEGAAAEIARQLEHADWRGWFVAAAAENLERWNRNAEEDRRAATIFLQNLSAAA